MKVVMSMPAPAPPWSPGGHRIYSEGDEKRLTFIRRGNQLGFTLDEAGIMPMRS